MFQKRNKNGITLIALVITIIVILILSGVAISMLIGNNSIVGKAVDATILTEIAELEEQANLIYVSGVTNKYTSGSEDILLGDIASELENKGYNIEAVEATETLITGISLDKSRISIAPSGETTITVSYNELTDGNIYYAVVKDKYYLMELNERGVKVSREATELSSLTNSLELTAESNNNNVTISNINENVITINSSENKGNSNITVKYGSYTANCMVSVLTPAEESEQEEITFPTNYGRIDVIWLDTSNNVINAPNDPTNYLAGMTKVTWTENADHSVISEDATPNENWYNYVAGSGTDDNRESHWANAKDSNGSYFVWIPRYAYRITYYESETSTSPTGYYDGWGMWKAEDGKVKYALDEGVETVDYNGNKYIVHPAFTNDSDTVGTKEPYDLGGWDSELAGFWVAKYEMSREDATESSDGSGTTFKSVPNVISARSITIGNMYTYGINYDSSKESHLMKNSEWGAVAYLTHSKYGRNGNEIDINNSGDFITGSGGGSPTAKSTNDSSNPGTAYSYNTAIGTKASTTGNVYGVYDMSGGAREYTASYDKLGSSTYVAGTSYGKVMTDNAKSGSNYISTKYITAYSNGTSTYSGIKIYTVGKVGDSTKEVYLGSGVYGWQSDYSYLCYASYPFVIRGGPYNGGAHVGVFYSSYTYGNSYSSCSFRAVLCP